LQTIHCFKGLVNAFTTESCGRWHSQSFGTVFNTAMLKKHLKEKEPIDTHWGSTVRSVMLTQLNPLRPERPKKYLFSHITLLQTYFLNYLKSNFQILLQNTSVSLPSGEKNRAWLSHLELFL
jgi:hypothetical protein